MAGFHNDILHADNVDFSGTLPVSGQINQDGELLIGSSTAPFIRPGLLTGTGGISITNAPGAINIDSQGTLSNLVFHTTSGQAQPSGSQINFANGSNITFSGTANTITTKLSGTTNHAVQIGNASGSLTSIAPAAAGLILTSNGLSSDPTWQIAPSIGAILYYLTNTASGVATYLKQLATPFSPKTDLSFAAIGSGNTLLKNWITDPGIPNLVSIPAGAFIFHIHADQTDGSRNVQLYAEIWESSSTGVDIAKIGTTELTPVLIGSETEYAVTFVTSSPYTMASTASRITTRVFASGAVTGSNATVHLFIGGESDSHIELPSSTVDVSNFVPYTGAVNDVNLGTHTISAASATLTSALTVPNGGTGVASFANTSALICSGTTTTGTLQNVASVATGQVLVSAGTSTLPAWSATPSLTSITFPSAGGTGAATNDTLSFYEDGTWTPTLQGSVTAGSTGYTSQAGIYTRIGNRVIAQGQLVITSATGTGVVQIAGFPFTFSNQSTFNYTGNIQWSGTGWTWPTGCTQASLQAINGNTIAQVVCTGSVKNQAFMAMANAAATIIFTIVYRA